MTAYTDALLAFSSSSYSLERALERVEAARTVRGVKIDPNSKTVEFVDLPLSVSTEDGHVEIEVTEGIRAALDLPSSCTMDRVRAGTEIGYVVHWDDIERLGSDAVGALPGFKFGELPTLRGPAVVYNPAVTWSHLDHRRSHARRRRDDPRGRPMGPRDGRPRAAATRV